MRRSPTSMPPALARAAIQFNRRRIRRTERRLGARLWAEAGSLARQFGVSRTAHALGLNYTRLKEQAGADPTFEALPKAPSSPRFVEVLPPGGLGPVECILEWERADGVHARLRLPGGSWDEWTALAQRLLEVGPCSK